MVNLPSPFAEIPRHNLLYPQPAPIEPLSNLTKYLSAHGCPPLYIKREDSNSGLGGGGNKIRKLEYVIPDALKEGVTVLVTTGGLQSNHMRQTAAAAARLSLKTHLLPRRYLPQSSLVDPSAYQKTGNIQLNSLMGATTATSEPDSSQAPESTEALNALRSAGEIPYWIPSGASTHPLGGLGYARFAFELYAQEQELGVRFTTIIVACNSGSTLGGMVAGFALLRKTHPAEASARLRELIGIDTYSSADDLDALVYEIAMTTAARLGLKNLDEKIHFVVTPDWKGEAYGVPTEATVDAVKLFASKEGIVLDPVYTGKAAAGLVSMAREGKLEAKEGEAVLFIHTGGVASLSAYEGLR